MGNQETPSSQQPTSGLNKLGKHPLPESRKKLTERCDLLGAEVRLISMGVKAVKQGVITHTDCRFAVPGQKVMCSKQRQGGNLSPCEKTNNENDEEINVSACPE